MKLGLGTVQFGMDYGVSNKEGQTSLEEAEEIIDTAGKSGVSVIDTAAAYGESEKVLGLLLPANHDFRITTKLPGLVTLGRGTFDPDEVVRLLERSLARLKQHTVYGLVLHRAEDLLSVYGDVIMRGLLKCKRLGMAAKIGVSVYAEDKIHELISRYPIDLIQAPVSILDQRLVQNGFLKRCRSLGIEIHARSVFLQGVLCMDPEQLPDYFRPYQAQIRKLRSYLSEHGVNPIEAALSFVNEMKEIDTFVCGVNNREQLQQLVYSLRRSNRELDFAPFAVSDPALLNPSQWIIHN